MEDDLLFPEGECDGCPNDEECKFTGRVCDEEPEPMDDEDLMDFMDIGPERERSGA